MKSPQYREGSRYAARPSMLATAGAEEKTAYCYCVVVDFLRSLTPEQVKVISKGPLFFSELDPGQQKMLLQLADNLDKKWKKKGSHEEIPFSTVARDSAGVLVTDFSYGEKGALLFTYTVPAGGGAYPGITMSFSVLREAKRYT